MVIWLSQGKAVDIRPNTEFPATPLKPTAGSSSLQTGSRDPPWPTVGREQAPGFTHGQMLMTRRDGVHRVELRVTARIPGEFTSEFDLARVARIQDLVGRGSNDPTTVVDKYMVGCNHPVYVTVGVRWPEDGEASACWLFDPLAGTRLCGAAVNFSPSGEAECEAGPSEHSTEIRADRSVLTDSSPESWIGSLARYPEAPQGGKSASGKPPGNPWKAPADDPAETADTETVVS